MKICFSKFVQKPPHRCFLVPHTKFQLSRKFCKFWARNRIPKIYQVSFSLLLHRKIVEIRMRACKVRFF